MLRLTRPAERGPRLHTQTRTLQFQPPRERARHAAHRLPHPHPYLGSQPPSTRTQKASPSPTPPGIFKSPPRGTQEIRLWVAGEPHPGAGSPEVRPRPGLPGGRFRAAPAHNPVLGPPAAPPPGWGRAGCRRRSAGRGGCAEERAGEAGEGRGGGGGGEAAGRGRPHLRHCNARSRRVIISGGNGQRGGAEEGASGARVGTDRSRRCLGHPREPATGRVPGIWRVGALPTKGDGTRAGRSSRPRR